MIISLLASGAWADFYVATNGSDNAAGTQAAPFQTLAKAQSAVRTSLPSNTPITVWVHGGTYYLSTPLVFTPADGGTATAMVTYRPFPGEFPVLSGGTRVTTPWTTSSGSIQVTTLAKNLSIDQLFLDGNRQILARYPNYDSSKLNGGWNSDCISANRVSKWKTPLEGPGYYRGMHYQEWGGDSYIITGVNPDGSINKNWMGDNNRDASIGGESMVENVFEELDAPMEWYYSKTTGNLYFYPPAGTNLNSAKVEVAGIPELIKVQGTSATKAKYITFNGLTLTQTHRTLFMPDSFPYAGLLRGDWAVNRAGTVFLQDAENITVENCLFDQVGGNGIFINGYNRNHHIYNNNILHPGASGVQIVGLVSAQRSPSSWIPDNHLTTIPDKTPGPQTADYPSGIVVENDSIYDVGNYEMQTAGVNISMAESTTVRHCTIHRSPRSGININDGSWGGNIVEFNDVWDCVRGTADHGPFNSWGRDRYWSFDGFCTNGCNGDQKKPYAFLDVVTPNTLRNNRWQDYRGMWGIDLDDGSSNYRMYNNLCLGMGVKLRDGFDRRFFNNIIINGTANFQCSFAGSNDSCFRNIIVGPLVYDFSGADIPSAQTKWDNNLLWNFGNSTGAGLATVQAAGQDAHAQVADPQFTLFTHTATDSNLLLNNYTLKSTSPALKLGFANFPMDSFGVMRTHGIAPDGIIARASTPSNGEKLQLVRNASSLILTYTLDQESPVTIDIIALNGEKIAELANSVEGPGFHRHDWNPAIAKDRATGIYFVRARIGSGQQTFKMIATN
jgi:hypothetical protein